jgi:hypothetical protein
MATVATQQEAVEAVLDELVEIARNPRIPSNAKSLLVLRLSEAYAWLEAPAQAHGSSPSGSDLPRGGG